jgi:hypothetical protein
LPNTSFVCSPLLYIENSTTYAQVIGEAENDSERPLACTNTLRRDLLLVVPKPRLPLQEDLDIGLYISTIDEKCNNKPPEPRVQGRGYVRGYGEQLLCYEIAAFHVVRAVFFPLADEFIFEYDEARNVYTNIHYLLTSTLYLEV